MKVSAFVRRSNNKRIIKRRFKNSLVSPTSFFDEKTELGGENIIYSNVNICGSQIGYASYINSNSNLMNCRIGKYCSIGSNVEIIAATHPTNFGSTYPGFYNCSAKIPFGVSKKHFDEFITLEDSFYCHIGNDVWIGNHVLIRGGIKIGDGAIIGMGSVVTKDVPPYSIVAGNPIRIIRYRFVEETVKILLKLKWWDLDPSFIKSHRDAFSNIDNLLSLLDKTKNK